jgi:plastocyanin
MVVRNVCRDSQLSRADSLHQRIVIMNKLFSSSIRRGAVCVCVLLLLVTACEPSPQASSFPLERTSYTQTEVPENTSYGRVSRFSSRIVVPLGRTREELTATLEQAARKLAAETGADAVMVFAYRDGDSPSGSYSAGRAIYAPNGKWEDAETGGPMRVQVDLNELYFAPAAAHAAVGDTVSLASSYDDRVSISKEYGAWGDEEIVARVANGVRAIVQEHRSEPMGDHEFMRYRILTLPPAPRHEGWVHKDQAPAATKTDSTPK